MAAARQVIEVGVDALPGEAAVVLAKVMGELSGNGVQELDGSCS